MRNRAPIADQLVWPRLARPPVPLVYLDLNHYVYMARSLAGDPKTPAGYDELLTSLQSAVDGESIVVALSSTHVTEVLHAVTDPRQRKDLADVMERLSRFHYLLGRPDIARMEIADGMSALAGEPPWVWTVPLVGHGCGRSFGVDGSLRIVDSEGSDASAAVRAQMGGAEFDALMESMTLETERQMLRGPADEDIELLRAKYGYRPEIAREAVASRLAWEVDLSARLDAEPQWRRGRLRDVVSAREVTHEWLDALIEHLEFRRRLGRPTVGCGQQELLALCSAMPHVQVAISIKTVYHRDPQHKWTINDIHDIDALSVAFAYCDVVFTDRAARSALRDSKDLRGFRTFVPRTPQELLAWLANPIPRTEG